jgi:hypothetical protein
MAFASMEDGGRRRIEHMENQNDELQKIERRLQSLEIRLGRLEAALNLNREEIPVVSEKPVTIVPSPETDVREDEDKGLESRIGRFGLAWLGNIVLIVGIAFLTQYLMNTGSRFISVILGYLAAGSIFFLSGFLKKTNVHLAFIFKMNAQVLLFYVTLRLHFFSASPILAGKNISLILLLALIALQVYQAVRHDSQVFGFLTVIFALTTSLVADATHITLPLIALTCVLTFWFFYRSAWEPLIIVTIILAYISYIMWLFGNPLMGHKLQMITEPDFGVVYLFGVGACFSLMSLLRKPDRSIDDFLIGVTIVNGVLFTLLLALVTLRFYHTNYVNLFAVITVCCLIYSTVLKSTSDWHFASAFYALYGFMAMSISLYGLFGFPAVYVLLSVQSLLVVSMALWFRNKLMIIMNSLLFLSILIIYLFSSKSVDRVNFAFALVPLISARVINWQRARLKIETDLMRNLYLIEGFIMVMYALYHAVPHQFITLSWTMAALLYFLLSFILKNVKYRYMALGTMICAAFYLFLVDLARIEIIYRVLALLFLAAISIGISIYYTNRIKKPGKQV